MPAVFAVWLIIDPIVWGPRGIVYGPYAPPYVPPPGEAVPVPHPVPQATPATAPRECVVTCGDPSWLSEPEIFQYPEVTNQYDCNQKAIAKQSELNIPCTGAMVSYN